MYIALFSCTTLSNIMFHMIQFDNDNLSCVMYPVLGPSPPVVSTPVFPPDFSPPEVSPLRVLT